MHSAPWPDMTPEEFKCVRQQRLRISAEALARVMHVSGRRIVNRWESGERDIPGPAVAIMRVLGEKPELLAEFVAAERSDAAT